MIRVPSDASPYLLRAATGLVAGALIWGAAVKLAHADDQPPMPDEIGQRLSRCIDESGACFATFHDGKWWVFKEPQMDTPQYDDDLHAYCEDVIDEGDQDTVCLNEKQIEGDDDADAK